MHFPFRGVWAAPECFLLRERRPEQLPLGGVLPERFPLSAMWHNVELVVVRRADAVRSVVGGLCGPPAWSARLHSIFSRSELACERPRESANVRPRGRGQLRPELAHVRPRGRGLLRPELAMNACEHRADTCRSRTATVRSTLGHIRLGRLHSSSTKGAYRGFGLVAPAMATLTATPQQSWH